MNLIWKQENMNDHYTIILQPVKDKKFVLYQVCPEENCCHKAVLECFDNIFDNFDPEEDADNENKEKQPFKDLIVITGDWTNRGGTHGDGGKILILLFMLFMLFMQGGGVPSYP